MYVYFLDLTSAIMIYIQDQAQKFQFCFSFVCSLNLSRLTHRISNRKQQI